MKRTRILLVVMVVFPLLLGVRPAVEAEESPVKAPIEKAVPEKKAEPEKKATLILKPGENNSFGIDLENSVPVRGVQFTLSGLKMTEVQTASRTEGFLAKFNEETGIVILVSTAADEIAPGNGPVLKILGEKVPDSEVSLLKIMIADSNRNLIE